MVGRATAQLPCHRSSKTEIKLVVRRASQETLPLLVRRVKSFCHRRAATILPQIYTNLSLVSTDQSHTMPVSPQQVSTDRNAPHVHSFLTK
jgi:hypothetical protein